MKFRKLPVVIDAVIWDGVNIEVVLRFLKEHNVVLHKDSRYVDGGGIGFTPADGTLAIPTLEGVMTASSGDYIIRGVKGALYPCKPDIFQATYERVV